MVFWRDNVKVLLEGPILTQSGYGEHTRLIHRALSTVNEIEIFINPLNWGFTGWADYFSKEEKESIDASIRSFSRISQKAKTTGQHMSFDLHIHVGILNEYSRKSNNSIHITAGIEADKISKNWILKTYKDPPNKIVFTSTHSQNAYLNTHYKGEANNKKADIYVNEKIETEVIPYPVKEIIPSRIDMDITTDFNFLSIALVSPRKNLHKMIQWFVEEFKNESVGLILKMGMRNGCLLDRRKTIKELKNILKKHKDRKCKVYLLHGDLTDEQIHSLYVREDVHAYTTTTCGEGYGLPIFEAAYSGLPIVATDWSGHLDFLSAPYKESGKLKNKKLFAKVDYDLTPIPYEHLWKDVIEDGASWAQAKPASFKKQIRKVFQNYGMYKKWATVLKEHINKTHSKEKINSEIINSIIPKLHATEKTISKMQGYEDEIVL